MVECPFNKMKIIWKEVSIDNYLYRKILWDSSSNPKHGQLSIFWSSRYSLYICLLVELYNWMIDTVFTACFLFLHTIFQYIYIVFLEYTTGTTFCPFCIAILLYSLSYGWDDVLKCGRFVRLVCSEGAKTLNLATLPLNPKGCGILWILRAKKQ